MGLRKLDGMLVSSSSSVRVHVDEDDRAGSSVEPRRARVPPSARRTAIPKRVEAESSSSSVARSPVEDAKVREPIRVESTNDPPSSRNAYELAPKVQAG
jgi:hypothetical protein